MPLILLLLLTCITPAALAGGKLSLSNTVLTLTADKTSTWLTLSNQGDKPLFLDVKQELVSNPGELPERRVLVEDVPHPDLLISQRRILLLPSQSKKLQITGVFTPEQTRVWRLTFINRNALGAQGDDRTAFVQLNVNYGAVIYHTPARRDQRFKWEDNHE